MTKNNRAPRFARNALAIWIGYSFTAIVGFLLSPYVVSHLGVTRYGVWSLIAGLVGYLGLLDLGIRQAVNRYTAHHHAAGEHQESSKIVSAALRLFGVLGIVAILLSVVLAYLAPLLFNIPKELADDARLIIVLGGMAIAVSLVGGVFGGVVSGVERFDIQCVLEIFVTSVRTAALVLALHEGYGLVAMAGIQLAASVLYCVVFWSAVHKLYSDLHIRLWAVLGPQVRTILGFSASLTVLYALGRIISYTGNVIIGAFHPIEAVAFFAIASSLAAYAKDLPKSLAHLMTPRVSALTSVGSDQVGELILRVAGIATLASTPIALTFLLRGESFITLWMGSAYGRLSGEVLQILAIVVWLDASRSVVMDSLTGMGKQRMVIPGFVIEAACNLALSLALVKPFGISSVALGTLIPAFVVSLGYIPRSLSRATGGSVSHFYRDGLLLPTVACIPFGVATELMQRFAPATNLPVFFMQTLLILPMVPVAAWFLCLSATERRELSLAIAKRLRR